MDMQNFLLFFQLCAQLLLSASLDSFQLVRGVLRILIIAMVVVM